MTSYLCNVISKLMKKIEEFELNGYKYIKNYIIKNSKFQIEHNKTKPDYIFKFYALSKLNIDAIEKGYIYASHPIELNDCLDSSPFLLYSSQTIDYDYYQRVFGEVMSENELKEFYRNDCSNENRCKGYISTIYELSSNLFGIISTTGKENNPLMWPHYTQEKGFQIKFKTQNLEQSIENKLTNNEEYLGIFPINYCENLSPIDVSSFQTLTIPLYYTTNVKSKLWNYEDEWRILVGKQNMGVPYSKAGLANRQDYLVNKENRYVFYDQNIIEEICLGVNFFSSREFEIEWINEKQFKVSPRKIKENGNYENQLSLLNYISKNLNQKLYYSGIKYELDESDKLFLIRTKEKLKIVKESDKSYILERTNEIIKLLN